ncbi:MAG: hydroxymethylbilane synthase [Deltaproteobacteria bacterium]|nr:MAG: hydroxymethylbilane synthase [Deltaproteobacteria bacterium]
MILRIATRRSPLALRQAERVQALLRTRGHSCELVPMQTDGDRIFDRSLAEPAGKALFVKELEHAILEGRADLAVHSAKDVPFALPPELALCAFPEREDARDALVAPRFKIFSELPRRARVGTSSLRRWMQLLGERPDLVIVPVRGNVQTRLRRAAAADGNDRLDAVVLAFAGLRRLGLEANVTELLPVELSLPAAGQGALAIEARLGSPGETACTPLDDARTSRCVRAERAFLARVGGGCTLPIAAYAVEEGPTLWLRAVIGGRDRRGGVTLHRSEARGSAPEALGTKVAEDILDRGGLPLLDASRAQAVGLPEANHT